MPPEDAAARGTSGGGDRGGDRLSGLRDEVLLRVLSHLKAWEAVRTCVLSKRWRHLWTYTGHLDIRQPCLCRRGAGLSADQRRAREKAFNTFVRKLLILRRPLVPLISFRFCWTHETRDGDTNTWISHAVRHKAEEIELSAKHHKRYPTPEYMSFIVDGEGLVKRGIAGEASVKTGLKILKLIHLRLDDTTLTQLCSRCTCLQEIELNDCLIPQATEIQSKLLKRLAVIKCKIPKGLLSVYAPNLVSLQFSSNFGYVPWIQYLGLLAASSVNQWVTHKYPDCSGLGSCNLEILKLSRVKLDDTILAQLCSRCTSLEKLELKECSVVGKDIRSLSLRCLTMVSCEFTTESVVHAPNLVSLCCTRPFRHVPQFQNMEFLVTASITLDDSCMTSDSQWTFEDDGKDEVDDGGDIFAHFRVDSDDNSDDESDQDEDESDHDGAHSGADGLDDNSNNESDGDYDSDGSSIYYDSDRSAPSDDEEDNCTLSYCVIAKEPYRESKYLIYGHKRRGDKPVKSCYEEYGSKICSDFGGVGMLCSLSHVKTMDLLAHPREVLLTRELKSSTDFKNLKILSLGEWCITPGFGELASILGHSPNLEKLFLHLDMAYNKRLGFIQSTSSFVCAKLKMVKIISCKHDVMVHRLAEFFRKNGVPPEMIFVHRTACSGCPGGRLQVKRKARSEN